MAALTKLSRGARTCAPPAIAAKPLRSDNGLAQRFHGDIMSWLPDNDPVLGDIKSCDALELVIVPRTRDLGDGFEVRRALPHGKRQMVGPFIFFDHFGPVQFVSGKGVDVRPHPHIGLATVTYLFDGSTWHGERLSQTRRKHPCPQSLTP